MEKNEIIEIVHEIISYMKKNEVIDMLQEIVLGFICLVLGYIVCVELILLFG